MDNQVDFLKRLKNSRPQKEEDLEGYLSTLGEIRQKMERIEGTIDEKRGNMMGLEGAAGKTYFDALSFVMPDRYKFNGRSRMPARDEFNCLLNYGYGVLYSMVEKACIIGGLDPYVGIIHTDHYNKKSLVFDLIELFRYLVDETVVYMFSQRKVKQEHFDKLKNGFTLNKEGKAMLIESLSEFLDESIRESG